MNPDKWQDRMRTVAASREDIIVEDDLDHNDTRGPKKAGVMKARDESPKKDQSWLTRLTASANEAIKVISWLVMFCLSK